MLETEIKALREEIVMLREAITVMVKSFAQKPETKKPEKAEKAEKVTVVKTALAPAPATAPAAPAPVQEPEEKAAQTITRDDLQNLCMTIVRADRSKREAVQQAISKYGAANLVAIKDSDLAALHADLEALK